MKICIQTLGIIAIATSLSYGQDAPKKAGKKHPEPEQMFKKLDTDGNGSIGLEEFKASPRAQKDPAKAEANFKKVDADGDGAISLEEFKSNRPQHGAKGAGKGGKGKKKGENGAE